MRIPYPTRLSADLQAVEPYRPARRERAGDAAGTGAAGGRVRAGLPARGHRLARLRRGAGRGGAAGHRLCQPVRLRVRGTRSEEHTSELQSLMRLSYAVSSLRKQTATKSATA